ncbi:hypothetical protein MAR_019050 [Mya arenaria]|uniref:Uncharacterized protein n=1 Tax=Mya arenaria TaxID=6604 RepID=A0ABY7EJK8_MYAAR|nr:hypothetical protein MAR_019050 [Mya arenaria]
MGKDKRQHLLKELQQTLAAVVLQFETPNRQTSMPVFRPYQRRPKAMRLPGGHWSSYWEHLMSEPKHAVAVRHPSLSGGTS